MPNQQSIDDHILSSLSLEHKTLVQTLEQAMQHHPERIADLGKFICDKMQKEGVVDFCTLSDETRLQATLEYVVIGLTSGVFKKEDFKPFM